MASIVHRNDCLLVVHYERDKISGKNKQKQELMEKNPTLHARFLRLYPKNVKSGMPRRFFSHLMFTMMPIWSWLSTRPLHAVCESLKFLVWHGTVSIFLRKASQPERHPSWLKKSSSVSTRRPWSLLSKRRPLPLPAELEAQHEHARSEKAQDRIEHSQGFYSGDRCPPA